MTRVPSFQIFWPSNRRLFRRRARVRIFVPVAAVVTAACLALAVGHVGWA
jgi:hypothetical protein